MLIIYDRRAAVYMKGQFAGQRAALYITAFISILLTVFKIYICCKYRLYLFAADGFLHAASASVCIFCAASMGRRREDIKTEALEVIAGFPQVAEIYFISCRRISGTVNINISLSFNTYSVHGSGALTCRSMEYALKKHFGSDARVVINVKRFPQTPLRRRKNS